MKKLLTKKQTLEIVSRNLLAEVAKGNCEPTCRVGYNGACQGNDLTEWAYSVDGVARDGNGVLLTAYYYTTRADDEAMAAADGDGSAIDWEIAGYEITYQ